MASGRFVKWDGCTIDTKAIADAHPRILRKNVAPLTRCLVAQLDDLYFGPDIEAAVSVIREDLDRIADALCPGYLQRQREQESRRRSSSPPDKKPIPRHLRKAVFERDDFRCRECGSRWELAADHVIPECRGGPTTLENLQTLCRACNSRKGGRMPKEEGPAGA